MNCVTIAQLSLCAVTMPHVHCVADMILYSKDIAKPDFDLKKISQISILEYKPIKSDLKSLN